MESVANARNHILLLLGEIEAIRNLSIQELTRRLTNSDDCHIVVFDSSRHIQFCKAHLRDEVTRQESLQRILWLWQVRLCLWSILYV